jgi:osmotically-inducible protein OsmY
MSTAAKSIARTERSMVNDRQLQQDVLAALEREMNLSANDIGVEVHHGVVKLAGTVSDTVTRQDALACAGRVPGVITVVPDIDVAGAKKRFEI